MKAKKKNKNKESSDFKNDVYTSASIQSLPGMQKRHTFDIITLSCLPHERVIISNVDQCHLYLVQNIKRADGS